MKGWRPPMVTRNAGTKTRPAELPDPNTESVPLFLTREELKQFKILRASGKILAFNVKFCRCGTEIPKSRTFCSQKCHQEQQNEA